MSELFIVKANLHQYYGRTITKEMEFDEKTDDVIVHQTLKDLVLTTEITRESEYQGITNKEHSTLVQTLPEGTVLIWTESEGYIIPSTPMYKIKDLEEEIKTIREVYKDNRDMNPKEG